MRENDTLFYLLGDHLGSTSLTLDVNGNKISELRYKPWGEIRYSSGLRVTDYEFTSQRSRVEDFGLLYYNARWYDSSLGRFAQADTIVPSIGNPMAWDRYMYTISNPLRYIDPSGHNPKCGPDGVWCDSDPDNDDDYPYMPGSYMPPPPLTEKGKEAYDLFRAYRNADGWWNADGNFTVEKYLGMWIMMEGKNESFAIWDVQSNWIAQAVAQNLYVGGWRDAQGSSSNAILNFMGSWFDSTSSVKAGPDPLFPTNCPQIDNPEAFMNQLGMAAVHPTQLNFDRNNAPTSWGNIKGAVDIDLAMKKSKTPYGPEVNSVYYINPSFLVHSVNQRAYWEHQGIDFSFYVPH